MRLSKMATAIGAFGLVVTPLVAQAAGAPLTRDASPVGESEAMGGSGTIIALLGLAAVIGGIIIAVEDEDEAVSP